MSQFLDNAGLAHYDEKIKEWAQGQFGQAVDSSVLERIAACERILSTFRVFSYGEYTPITREDLTPELRLAALESKIATLRIFSW